MRKSDAPTKPVKEATKPPKPAVDTKIQAVAKIAYDRAETALQVATNQSALIDKMTKAIRDLHKEDKAVKGYRMKLYRNEAGFLNSIDVEIK